MNLSDLSPDALAQLEARLMEDVQVVRRMRALMEEYRHRLVPGAAAFPVPAAAPATVAPAPPRKGLMEAATECLLGLPAAGFRLGDLRYALRAQDHELSAERLKALMGKLMRQGKAAVVETRSGRGGSVYRCTLPRPDIAPEPPQNAPVSPEIPAVEPGRAP